MTAKVSTMMFSGRVATAPRMQMEYLQSSASFCASTWCASVCERERERERGKMFVFLGGN